MADIDISIGADSSQFATGMAAIKAEAAAVGQAVTSSLSGLVSLPALAAAAFTVGIKGLIDYGDKISDVGKAIQGRHY